MLQPGVLKQWFQNSAAIEAAIEIVGIDPVLACAIVEKETSGRHVYGNDSGGVFSTPGAPDIVVTRENFQEFLRRVLAGETSNGVGIMQITYAGPRRADGTRAGGFFTQAESEGLDLADPLDNCVFGFKLLKSYLAAARAVPGSTLESSIKTVGKRYNGASAYGDALWTVYQKWAQRLSATPVPAPAPTPPPTTGGTMPVILHGKKACTCQQKTIGYIERDLRAMGVIIKDLSGLITQQAYNSTVNASGSTHDGGGVWDVKHSLVDTDAKKKIWARNGWIPFDRRTIDAPVSKWPNHGHVVVAGCPHRDASAVKQEASARAGKNALANNGPFRGNPGPLLTWEQAVARETGSPGLPSSGADGWDGKSFPGVEVFRDGTKHAAVLWVQKRLVAHGFTPGPLDSLWGAKTKAAVAAFQRKQDWTGTGADGIPGTKTWAELSKAPVAASAPAPAPSTARVLKRGSTGTDVKNLQVGLLRVFPSYAGRIRTNGGPNTTFGPATETVVKEFQRRSKLTVDGIVGSVTRTALGKHGIKF